MRIMDLRRGPDEISEGVDGPGALVTSNHLLVDLDVFDDETKVVLRRINFADYSGLEFEWTTGTSTTILDTALQALVDAEDDTDPLSTVQRAKIGTTLTKT